VNPVTGRRELILVSQAQERELGREGAERVAATLGIFVEPELTGYVAAVGQRVAARSPRPGIAWRFEIVDQGAPNAFALPDGHLYVSRGLLELASSEDELAAVLAHEVVHVAARHHAQQQTRATGVGLLAIPVLLAGAALGGPVGEIVQAPFVVLGSGIVASYGRGQEREADRVGQRLAAEAGYDPAALASYLATLEGWSRRREGRGREPGFFDTHPSTPERLADARAHAAGLAFRPVAGVAPDRESFLGRLDGLVVGENPAEGVFQGASFLHPDLDFSLRFPEGWRTANARTAVGAFAPDGRASLVLELQGRGDDPRTAAAQTVAAISRETHLDVLRAGALEIGGRRAFRVEAVVAAGDGRRGASGAGPPSGRGATTLHLTWIAHGGAIYRIAGAVDGAYADAHRGALEAASGSFHPLTPAERASIRQTRLRVARARAGESLAALAQRTGAAWEPDYAAIVNGLPPDAPLPGGRLVKVALREPYAPAPTSPAEPPAPGR
jgi:predicted Zn-dependent protease